MAFRLTAVWVLALVVPAVAAAQGDLARARTLYNSGQYEESIAAANAAKSRPSTASSAALIIARSRLERFRKSADPMDLAAGRSELISVDPRTLTEQESIEWQVGVGIALFLEGQIPAAAEAFGAVLPAASERLTHAEYEKLLEWRGTAVSRLAESLAGDARRHAYEALRSEVVRELDRNPLSRRATYWAVIAARGVGALDAAWGGAIAGWIRAGNQPEGLQLRADVEQFVIHTLIPERAQARTGQRLDAPNTVHEITAMTEEWQAVTKRWIPER